VGIEVARQRVLISPWWLWRLADQGKQGEWVLLYKHPERERETESRCGVTVRCSALWECVEVQWCCHGDKLRRSVLEVGVTECKSAHPTSTLIFTARATRQHLTRAGEQLPPFDGGEARACRGSRVENRRAAQGFQARWEEEGGI